MVAVSRHVLANPPDMSEFDSGGESELAIMVLIGGLAMLEIVLLAGPAFAVGARRRQRDLALVAAVGGNPAHVRRIVLADGAVLGVLAAAVGVVVGVAGAAGTHSMFDAWGTRARAPFRSFRGADRPCGWPW